MKIDRHILTLLLTALLAVGNVTAQTTTGVVVKGSVYGGGNEGEVGADSEVEIKAGTVKKDIYGGGNKADVSGNVSVTMTGGTVEKDVYGGGALANTNTDNSTSAKTTTVNLQGGTIMGDAYGGGLGRAYVEEKPAVEADPEHGIEAQAAVPAIAAVEATVYGDITVYLGCKKSGDKIVGTADVTAFNITYDNAGTAQAPIQVVKSGRLFGCNNLNGSPQGNVTVNIYKTKAGEGITHRTPDAAYKKKEGETGYVAPTYEVAAVYGGGNLANYTTAGKKTNVNILNCDVSVESVYGGGNAAAVPETDVQVDGAYEIGYVFGGGNGKDKYTLDGGETWNVNQGANVNGNTKVLLQGGYIHEAYGGSNEKGAISGAISLNTGTEGTCDLEVLKLVGAGKNADIDGNVILVLGCMPDAKVDEIYGGADNANVNGNVELTITSGNFGKVFGGNNRGGIIKGHIILNIEETGTCDTPINIDELYLGGNEAAYSVYGYNEDESCITEGEKLYDNPILNIRSFTSIGEVYGGGLGASAIIYGNPTVNINTMPGSKAALIDRDNDGNPDDSTGKLLGTIGDVFGGGNEAKVVGNTTVNIGTETTVDFVTNPTHLGTFTKNATSGKYQNVPVAGANITGNVYGGGNEADVTGNTLVNICAKYDETEEKWKSVSYDTGLPGVSIAGNIFGGGKGKDDNFTCDKAMVGVNDEGQDETEPGKLDKGTKVIIGNGTVNGNVYGGGEVGRVEWNTVVTIGVGDGGEEGTSKPEIRGSVFGAGKGKATHGYSALVRGDCTVTIEGNAQVKGSVYGGGEIATAGRYWIKDFNNKDGEGKVLEAAKPVPEDLPSGLPYKQRSGGVCTVTIRGHAEIGPETPTDDAGNVFGGGKGVEPIFTPEVMTRMVNNANGGSLVPFEDKIDETTHEVVKTAKELYLEFLQTLALVTNTFVNIDGEHIKVTGSVYGGSENGFVSTHTDVKIKNGFIGTEGTAYGNVYGGGKGTETFAEAGKVIENTSVAIIGATTYGSVYGGGELGNVKGNTKIEMNGGTVAKNIYGGGKGKDDTFTCEKGMVGVDGDGEGVIKPGEIDKGTKVIISNGTVNGNVYGGGEVGRVEWNTVVEIGVGDGGEEGTFAPVIHGSVFGAGKGVATHGYSALVRGDCTVTIDGKAKVKGSVYGGGEIATAGRYWVKGIRPGKLGKDEEGNVIETEPTYPNDNELAPGLPYKQRSGGICTVLIKGSAEIGPETPTADAGNVFGAGKGVTPHFIEGESNRWVKDAGLTIFTGNATTGQTAKEQYLEFLQTLALVTNTKVTIDGAEAKVRGSVYGGSENGFVQTHTDVKILNGVIGTEGTTAYGNVYGGGKGFDGFAEAGKVSGYTKVAIGGATIHGSVYGGGELGYVKQDVTVDITAGEVKKDVYGGGALANTNTENWNATSGTWATDMVGADGKTTYKTLVNLSGGTVKGDIYGGGLGRLEDTNANSAVTAVEAKVYGDVTVTTTGGKAGRVFGCNNLNGAPQGIVAVNIIDTEHISTASGDYAIGNVYGGGNQAAYSYNDAGHPLTVTMAGGTVNNIFGGGLSADVAGSIAVNVTGGLVLNDVYGGGALANTNTGNVTDYGTNSATISSTSTYTTTVNLTGGTIGNAYGGGLGELGTGVHYSQEECNAWNNSTNISGWIAENTPLTEQQASLVNAALGLTGDVAYNTDSQISADHAAAYNATLDGYRTTDDWKIHPSVGEGAIKAIVYGDIKVIVNELNQITHEYGTARFTIASENQTYNKKVRNSQNVEETVSTTGLVYSKGRVFGCNNVNGTPKGDVTVTVWRTLPQVGTEHIYTEDGGSYEIQAVYGGGNMADYEPATTKKPTVNIHGCGETSIQYVFGGGNAASVPETHVNIYGTFEIEAVFGGGNGNEPIYSEGAWKQSPGAEILGDTNVKLMAGLMHQAFGGSFEKGIIRGTTNLVKNTEGGEGCDLKITDVFGGGKDADVQEVNIVLSECTMDQAIGDVQASDVTQQIENVYAGSYNARILGNVTMTIQSGTFKNVIGGNYSGGFINGQITLNVEETSSCKPVRITNLYGGGNYAPYPGAGANNQNPKITINVKACTSIGNVYGGSYHADVNGNTEVNINMIKGWWAGKRYPTDSTDPKDEIPNAIGVIGNVFGGGDQGDVIGNTVVNIGNLTEIDLVTIPEGDPNNNNEVPTHLVAKQNGKYDVLGAKITGNVYGGGNQADVTGITNVNICAIKTEEWQSVATGASGVTVSGSVYGGGKGKADNFECDKAMVGRNNHGVDDDEGNTYVRIGNGTVGVNVYGGGEIGRVESHTNVMIGIGSGEVSETPSSAPVITGSVFGAGQGVATHGYSGLVRGNSTVTIQGNAEVGQSVYGGGQKATVGRFWVKNVNDDTYEHKNDYPDVPTGMPYALMSGGACSVTIQGYAKIGPDNMVMPTFSGHVFGAGKGLMPYLDTDTESGSGEGQGPGRWYAPGGTYTWQSYAENETKYLEYLQTLALADETDVIITGHAFIKGSVYGGSENGRVLDDTNVKIQEHCQIGNGWNKTTNSGVNSLYTEDEWAYDVTSDATKFLYECNSWPYTAPYTPYDKYNFGGGSENATDGHTFYGNVFGGGSGYFPYASGKWHSEAGAVGGNTTVEITGGHILTNVYGGNELTNVAGSCTVKFNGTATLGVPRTLAQIEGHPVTCYLFGAGKGDQRSIFNSMTNVGDVNVQITGGRIYGSALGGAEDGHVLGNVTMTIGKTDGTGPTIGTWGTSYLDGNVFGGGRGFSGTTLGAGNVKGNITMDIKGGSMLGNIYGGGRMASVGTDFTSAQDPNTGQFIEDDETSSHGHITINISGGTIGSTREDAVIAANGHTKGGNVFGGSMGRLTLLDNTPNELWTRLAQVKTSSVNITGTALIKSNVYGGAEFGTTRDNVYVTIGGSRNESTDEITASGTPTINGHVYGGGYGSTIDDASYISNIDAGTTMYLFTPMQYAGCVGTNTFVNVVGEAHVLGNVYGGGEMASVGVIDYSVTEDQNGDITYENNKYKYVNVQKHDSYDNEKNTFHDFGLSWPYKFNYLLGGKTNVNITGSAQVENYVFGGGKGKVWFGATQETPEDITQQRYREAHIANVRETEVTIGTSDDSDDPHIRTVYGGGEDGHVIEDAKVTIHHGTITKSVFGGGKGEGQYTTTLRKATGTDLDPQYEDLPNQNAYSWTAGRVYGNTYITMNGGSVGWFIYGGGNLGSVGKGSYSGGSDDYSTVGYGELPSANGGLWTATTGFNPDDAITTENTPTSMADYFLSSGKATVNLLGGTVGSTGAGNETDYDEDGIPHGSVFGGSRGKAAASCKRSPRYRYVPDFFLGYVNKAIVNIGGTSASDGPTIYGSVYGGGQDGHVRNSTEVKINKGSVLGMASDGMGRSGNVFGAGSGIGTYDTKDAQDNPIKAVNNSSGSVTCTTLVEVNGGTIKGGVYGGGALASVGPPKTGGTHQTYDEKNTPSGDWKSYTYSQVNIKGGIIGGNVFAASRGPGDKYLATNPKFDTDNYSYDATKYATDIWPNVHVSGGKIGYDSNDDVVVDGGSVYGGGETGQVKCGVTVNITGGEIAKDVYGGGALAHTNTSVWVFNRTNNKYEWTDATNKTAQYTTTVNLLGGIIHGDAYGGGLGRFAKEASGTEGTEGYVPALSAVEPLVYGDVKVNLNGLEEEDYDANIHGSLNMEPMLGGNQLVDDVKGTIVSRIFGCNNLNGSPLGAVRVHVFATQNADSEHNTIIKKYPIPSTENEVTESVYDMAAVYGGGNLAAYTPMGNATGTTTGIDNDYKNTTQRSEVIIDGCDRTSIKQVYGGSNAASAPATYLEVNGTYEIEEAFGGGNGADDITINSVTMANPGANVGYVAYPAEDDIDGSGNKDKTYRQDNYGYGTGVATTMIKGGKIHNVYGGSNKKGNIRTTALSLLESMNDACDMDVDQSYGGGKDAKMDAVIDTRMQCAQGVKEVFGGSMNADVNSDITLTITNGSSLERVFGGNNTSGAIAGSITVNIEEGGCEPIIIKELYAGGYLAPYSIYGYEKNNDGTYKTENIDYGGSLGTIAQRIPLTKEEYEKLDANVRPTLQKEPRINVISATRIDDIYGGGYRALVVGSPHVNVNMTNGKVEVSNTATTGDPAVYKDVNGITYTTNQAAEDKENKIYYTTGISSVTTGEGESEKTTYYATLPIGTIGNIYGGGNLADIVGDTYVEIGTGKWLTWDDHDNPVWETTDADGNTYTSKQTGNASYYTQAECSKQNAKLRGYIPSGVKLSADQATAVNTALGLTGENAYVQNGEIYTEDAAIYNTTLDGFRTTSTVKENARNYTQAECDEYNTANNLSSGDAGYRTTEDTKPAVYYTQAECNEYNKNNVNNYIACTTALTAKQAVAVNEAIGSDYASGAVIYTEDAAAYIATLNGHITTADVNTPATWTWYKGDDQQESTPVPSRKAATITGNVFGGGKGKADTFQCEKAMVGVDGDGVNHPEGGTNVTIANGTVGTLENGKLKAGTGNVYGGGEIGRVEKNTVVTIGVESTDAPEIYGDVFGAGKGVETHGYSALVRGNPTVIVQGKSKVLGSVFGGGEIASVARYKVVNSVPVALANKTSGNCKVIIRGDAEIGPDGMTMTKAGGPDDTGHVFGAGKGFLPKVYDYATTGYNTSDASEKDKHMPKHMVAGNTWEYYSEEADYLGFIETLALSSKTDVTIGGNAFVKGSVYGGSLNGIVQYDTHVTIEGHCQIGRGNNDLTQPYGDAIWADNYTPADGTDLECAHWDYDKNSGAPYDPFAKYKNTEGGKDKYYYDETHTNYAEGGSNIAKDGHTYYGNVFGGGSGVIPYAPGKWHRAAGIVRGNTVIDITGGHILTSIYGGNEHTDVGTYDKDATNNDEPIIPKSGGLCTVNFGGTATLGVPRTLAQIAAHPVTCYLFGAGKGDQRIFFNTWTNIREAEVNITGGRIYGSVFGGGEDGHVVENVTVNINESDYTNSSTNTRTLIGTTGTSYVDGNVFGAGRGFSGEALTAGSVGGNVEVNIAGGTMLGSVYGGGRLASVGTFFTSVTDPYYGQLHEDVKDDPATTDVDETKTHGHITINISGGTIGNDEENILVKHTKGGNVFGGSMGRLKMLDDETTNPLWPKMGTVKTTKINIYGDALIKSNVYGGGEYGMTRGDTHVTIGGILGDDNETITSTTSDKPIIKRDVFGGGYGSDDFNTHTEITAGGFNEDKYTFTPMQLAGIVCGDSHVNIKGGHVQKNVYGGGELATVGLIDFTKAVNNDDDAIEGKHDDIEGSGATEKIYGFGLSWPYKMDFIPYMPDGTGPIGGTTNINVTGGRLGLSGKDVLIENGDEIDNGDIYGGSKGKAGDRYDMAFCGNVKATNITINYPSDNGALPTNYKEKNSDGSYKYDCIAGAVYGGGEDGHVIEDTHLTLKNGLIGHALYGGGSGKGEYKQNLLKIGSTTEYITPTPSIYSITAGKVYGNTHVKMEGGYVVRFVYGGGNMGSVGKGNYASGADDYYPAGYGETLYRGENNENNKNLWTAASTFKPDEPISESNKPTTWADYFLSSGKTKVEIIGGQVGYVNTTDITKSMKDGLPYGSVFGGSRGESAPNIRVSPRYHYSPEFFSGYVNETEVTIGGYKCNTPYSTYQEGDCLTAEQYKAAIGESDASKWTLVGPKILGSVFGGGQDGHVRRDTHVIVDAGEIGLALSGKDLNNNTNETVLGSISTNGEDNPQWLHRGNVYGAGSGIGEYEYDFNYDGDTDDTNEKGNSTSGGSVTRFTQVDIHGGTIHRNVYGGGSLSSIGPLKINQADEPYKKGDTTDGHGPGLQSQCTVTIGGGAGPVTIGTPTDYQEHYGGEVYGASRGDLSIGENFGVTVWTQVFIKNGAHILGNVFGGGDNGKVKKDAEVFIGEKKVTTSTNSEPEPTPGP